LLSCHFNDFRTVLATCAAFFVIIIVAVEHSVEVRSGTA